MSQRCSRKSSSAEKRATSIETLSENAIEKQPAPRVSTKPFRQPFRHQNQGKFTRNRRKSTKIWPKSDPSRFFRPTWVASGSIVAPWGRLGSLEAPRAAPFERTRRARVAQSARSFAVSLKALQGFPQGSVANSGIDYVILYYIILYYIIYYNNILYIIITYYII